jgi:hypothetical protein
MQHLIEMYFMRIFRERVKTSWGRDSMLLKGLLESRYHHRIYMNKTKQSRKRVSRPFRAYEKNRRVTVLLKDLPKPPNRT